MQHPGAGALTTYGSEIAGDGYAASLGSVGTNHYPNLFQVILNSSCLVGLEGCVGLKGLREVGGALAHFTLINLRRLYSLDMRRCGENAAARSIVFAGSGSI